MFGVFIDYHFFGAIWKIFKKNSNKRKWLLKICFLSQSVLKALEFFFENYAKLEKSVRILLFDFHLHVKIFIINSFNHQIFVLIFIKNFSCTEISKIIFLRLLYIKNALIVIESFENNLNILIETKNNNGLYW